MTVADLLAELVRLELNKPHGEHPEGDGASNWHPGYFVMQCVSCGEAAQAAVGFTTSCCGMISCMEQAGEPVDKNVYHDI